MPRAELDGFDRHYLDHGLTTTWDGSITMLAGTGVGGGTLINWMTCIDAPEIGPRRLGARARSGGRDRSRLGSRHRQRSNPSWASRNRPTYLRRTRSSSVVLDRWVGTQPLPVATQQPVGTAAELRVRLPAGDEAIGDPRPSRRRVGGRRPHRGRRESDPRPHRERRSRRCRGGTDDGARIRRRRRRTPRRLIVHAPVVVLAAGALRTPAILQRSGLEHPAIGRYLRLHPVPVIAGRFDETVEMWRGTLQAARSLEFSEPDAGRNGYVIEAAPGHPGLLALALPWEGAAAHAGIIDRVGQAVTAHRRHPRWWGRSHHADQARPCSDRLLA